MHSELIRAVVAAPVVVVLPHAFSGRLRRPHARLLFGLVLMIAALAPYLETWRAWVVIVATSLLAMLGEPKRLQLTANAAQAAFAAVVAALAIDQVGTRHGIAHVADARGVVIVLAGFAVSTFIAGAAIGHVLHPFAAKLGPADTQGLERAGRVIGWLERSLLYGLVLAGAPDAAAIVVAAKSVARFPSFEEERFAEYYLIGTLLSFLSALVVGVCVRAALGIHPLLSAHP